MLVLQAAVAAVAVAEDNYAQVRRAVDLCVLRSRGSMHPLTQQPERYGGATETLTRRTA